MIYQPVYSFAMKILTELAQYPAVGPLQIPQSSYHVPL